MTSKKNSVRIAVVGADREGLEILSMLVSQKDVNVLALVDPNEKALGFRLKDYGYAFEDSVGFKRRHRLKDLSHLKGLDLIIDASPGRKCRRDLIAMDLYPCEVMSGVSAHFLLGILKEDDMARRRTLAKEGFGKTLEALDPSLAGDEPYTLLIRILQMTTKASGTQGILLDGKRAVGDFLSRDGIKVTRQGMDQLMKHSEKWGELITGKNVRVFPETGFIIEDQVGIVPWRESEEREPHGISILTYNDVDRAGIEEDLRFAAELAQQSAAVLRTFRSREESQLKTLQTALQEEITGVLSSPQVPLHEILRTMVLRLSTLVMARGCHLYIQDPQTEDLTLVGTTHIFPEMQGQIRIKKNQGILGEVIRRNQPVFLKEIFPVFDDSGREQLPSWDVGGILYLPLKAPDFSTQGQEKTVGLMVIEFSTLRWMNETIYQTLLRICGVVGGVIGNDTERYRMSQKVTRLSVVNEEGVELLSSLDRQKVLTIAASSAAMIVDAEAAVFHYVGDNGGLLLGATYGLHEEEGSQNLLEVDRQLSERVMENKEPLFISDVREEGGGHFLEKSPYRAGLILPVLHDRKCLGVLSVYNKLLFSTFASTAFTEDDLEVLERYNLYVARSILTIRKYSEQQALVTIDKLTGFRNERYLQIRLPEEVRRAKRYNRQLSLIFLEILEEEKGLRKPLDDETLLKISHSVQETFRYIDVLVRLKGSRFGALLPDTGEGVQKASTRIGAKIIEQGNSLGRSFKFQVGYSTYPLDGEEVADLVKKASKLYPYRA
ncbi:MAG: GAF domain-containing protein [Nitrospirae bacterium]|nr:GAF domain-containing protein [Nitrospirota bacterium]